MKNKKKHFVTQPQTARLAAYVPFAAAAVFSDTAPDTVTARVCGAAGGCLTPARGNVRVGQLHPARCGCSGERSSA